MKNFLLGLLKAYAILAAWAVAVVSIVVGALFWGGTLSPSRLKLAYETLRGKPPAVAEPAAPARPAESVAEREQILEQRSRELRKLDERTGVRLALIRAEQETP